MVNAHDQKFDEARKLLDEQFTKEREALKQSLESSRQERAERDANYERRMVDGQGPAFIPKGASRGEPSMESLITKHRDKWKEKDEFQLAEHDAKRQVALARLEGAKETIRASNLTARQLATDAAIVPKKPEPSRATRRNLSNEYNEQSRTPNGFPRVRSESEQRDFEQKREELQRIAREKEIEKEQQRSRERER